MNDALIRLPATEAVRLLRRGDITPLDLIDAAEGRITAVEPEVNALPTLCFDRARAHAKRLMNGQGKDLEDKPGWLAGLPVTIKDLMDVEGVRTTYGSPIFANHIPAASHPLVKRIESLGGIVIAKSNTPEFGAGGSTFNEVFGRTRNPWNTSLTCGGSTGGGAVSLATGEAWLAQGSDHGGSLRRPATFCGVVGLRPSPGRVTRGTSNSLFSAQSVEGPMARNVPDLALFLDTMAGWCPLDPMTFDAPARPYAKAVADAEAERPKRIAYVPDFNGKFLVDRETLALCSKAVRQFEALGCVVEDVALDPGAAAEAFMTLRAQAFVVAREEQLNTHRDRLKPDIIWNTEQGLKATPSAIARAERERAAFFRRVAALFAQYDVLITPGAPTPAFDVMLRNPASIAGVVLENYMGGSMLNAAITLTGCPAVAVPCGFDRYGRPVGLQVVAPPRREDVALQASALFERMTGLSAMVPVDPRRGPVPPPEAPDY